MSTRVCFSLNSKVRSSQPAFTAWRTGAVTTAGSVRDLFQPGFLVGDIEKYQKNGGERKQKRKGENKQTSK